MDRLKLLDFDGRFDRKYIWLFLEISEYMYASNKHTSHALSFCWASSMMYITRRIQLHCITWSRVYKWKPWFTLVTGSAHATQYWVFWFWTLVHQEPGHHDEMGNNRMMQVQVWPQPQLLRQHIISGVSHCHSNWLAWCRRFDAYLVSCEWVFASQSLWTKRGLPKTKPSGTCFLSLRSLIKEHEGPKSILKKSTPHLQPAIKTLGLGVMMVLEWLKAMAVGFADSICPRWVVGFYQPWPQKSSFGFWNLWITSRPWLESWKMSKLSCRRKTKMPY